MSAVAFIHLPKQSRHVSAKIAQFLRPDVPPVPEAQDLHLWEGRLLTAAEFNEQLPIAIRRMQDTQPVLAKIVVLDDQPDTGSAEHAAEIEALKAAHAAEIAAIQEGVNEFTAQHNAKLEELQQQLAAQQEPMPDEPEISTESERSGGVETAPPAPQEPEVAADTAEAHAEAEVEEAPQDAPPPAPAKPRGRPKKK